MQIKIYADIVFFINLIMDFLIFYIVSRLSLNKAKISRIFLGSLFSAFTYCLIIFIPKLGMLYNYFSSFIILSISVYIIFGRLNIKKFIRLIFYSYISAFTIGGLSSALFYYTNTKNIIGNMLGVSIEHFSFKILIISICSVYIIIKFFVEFIRKILVLKQSFYDVTIFFNNNKVNIRTLLDTGNNLEDPISKNPVLVVEFRSIKKLLPDKIQLLFYEKREKDINNILKEIDDTNIKEKIRIIPFKSIGEENGILLGFVPDKIQIDKENHTLELNNIVIGIYNVELSSNGDYQGLLSQEILQIN